MAQSIRRRAEKLAVPDGIRSEHFAEKLVRAGRSVAQEATRNNAQYFFHPYPNTSNSYIYEVLEVAGAIMPRGINGGNSPGWNHSFSTDDRWVPA